MPSFHADPARCLEFLTAIVGGTSDRVAVIDTDYRFVAFNAAYQRDFEARFRCSLALGASFLELVRDRDCALATFGKALAGERHTVEQAIGDGPDRHWYEIEVYPLRVGDRVDGAVHIARDVTARKTAQYQLRRFNEELERQVEARTRELAAGTARNIAEHRRAHEAQRRLAATAEAQRAQLQAILDRIVQGIVILNADGSVRTMNPAALALHGIDGVEDLRGPDAAFAQGVEARHPDGRPMPADWPVARARAGESVRDFELHARDARTGAEWVAACNSTPVIDADGELESVVVTMQDITERKRTELTLLEADRRKDEFIATLAHELRNPLAPMLNAIQILQLDGDADVTRQRAKDIIERQVQQMARLIDDLLDISRITLGKLALRREPVELAAVVEEAVELARPHIVAYEHRFALRMAAAPVRLRGDATRLAQVLSNLLINAAKYTPRRGEITLTVEATRDEAIVRVRDTGIGIAPEHLARLFEKFSQVRSAQDRTGGGLGIGLALARGLVHMHGGTISASSPGIGGGAEFVIRLPALCEPEAGSPHRDPVKSATAVPIGGLKVLVADDNEDAVESAAMVLALNGNQVQLASDGLEAVLAADRYRPDVVLLDIGMPKLNGFEACRRIRSEPWGKDMLLVAVTGWGQEEDRRRTAEAGFDAHFTKPVDFASVMALIGRRRSTRMH